MQKVKEKKNGFKSISSTTSESAFIAPSPLPLWVLPCGLGCSLPGVCPHNPLVKHILLTFQVPAWRV